MIARNWKRAVHSSLYFSKDAAGPYERSDRLSGFDLLSLLVC